MALDKATAVHFDRYDGTTVTDADGTIHFPVLRHGSTMEFHMRFRDIVDLSTIGNANYTITGAFKANDAATTVQASVTVTDVDGTYSKVRVAAADMAGFTAYQGVFNMEYKIDDDAAGPILDDMVHQFAKGTYIMVTGDVT